jgi:hypothetical protein
MFLAFDNSTRNQELELIALNNGLQTSASVGTADFLGASTGIPVWDSHAGRVDFAALFTYGQLLVRLFEEIKCRPSGLGAGGGGASTGGSCSTGGRAVGRCCFGFAVFCAVGGGALRIGKPGWRFQPFWILLRMCVADV